MVSIFMVELRAYCLYWYNLCKLALAKRRVLYQGPLYVRLSQRYQQTANNGTRKKYYIYEQMVWPRYAVKVSSYTNSPIRAQESPRMLPFQVQTPITDEMRGREEDLFTDTHTTCFLWHFFCIKVGK